MTGSTLVDWLTRSPVPLVLCAGLYVLQAIAFWRSHQRGLGVTFIAYALGNVGLIWAWYEVRH